MRSVAVAVACTLAVCVLIAAALAALVPGVGGFRVALVNSLCIGMTAHLLIHGGWHLFWHGDEPPVAGMMLLCVASVLAAIWVGGQAAAALLGEPADWLSGDAGGIRVAALLATIGGTTTMTGVIWLRQYLTALRLRAQLEQARADAAARLVDEARLRMLRAQLEPHMLFNTLATLRALIEIDPDRAQDMLDHLVAFLRTTLNASRTDEISLETEFRLLDSYLSLMAIRMGPRLSYRLDLPSSLGPCRVPPMLIQPIVENAVRHGLEPRREGGSIEVRARQEKGRLCIDICDTGEGFDFDAVAQAAGAREHSSDGAGFGLDAVRARLRSAYGELASLEIRSPSPPAIEGGTRVTLQLPLDTARRETGP
jgi:hypothetical protein